MAVEMIHGSLHKQGIDELGRRQSAKRGQRGQIVIEYVLLLIIAISVALLITRVMIRNDETDPGIVLRAWVKILDAIGEDKPDDIKRN